jgi:tetratricopeptide (TPR) repeat protein/transcription elongation GreA/GreB family factor
MPTRVDYPIPPPTTWEAFESLCRDLWAEVWNDNNTQKNGRQGQPQHGVDVYGEAKKGSWSGLQAKEKDQLPAKTLSIAELRTEVNKAKSFNPSLKEYIVATTGPGDVNVQEEARKITEENRKNGLFDVFVYGWEDIEPLLKKHQSVYKLHYPQHFPDLDAVESLAQKVLNEQKENSEKSSEEIGGLRFEMKSEFKHLAEQTSVGGDVTQEHQAELDYARDLIDQHKPVTALRYIEPVKNRIWNQTSQNVRFRLLTNIAAAKLQIGDDKKAAQLFIEALQYNPDDEKALCNVALAYILLNKPDKAEEYVKEVLSKNPASGRAYSMLIQIRSDSSSPIETIIKEIPSEYHDLPEVAYALGTVCRRSQEFLEAQKWFEKLKRTKGAEPEYLVSLATTLLASISKDMHILFSKKLNKGELEKVKEATNLFEQAWNEIKSYEDNSLKIECLVNKGISYLMLGDSQKAAISFDDALIIEPDNPSYIFNRAYIDYESDKKDLALERLKKISKNPEIPAAILIGYIYLSSNSKNPEILRKEALPVINDYISLNPSPFLKGAAQRLLIQMHITLGELKVASDLVDKLVKQYPKNINTLVSKSRVYRLLNDKKTADETLSEAEKLVTENTTYFDLLALADEYNFIGQFDKAAKLYERVTDSSIDSELTRRLIDCDLKAGKNKEALAICESIRTNQGLIREVLELEANLYEDIGDLKTAKQLCKEYLKENPADERVRLHLAAINYRSQKWSQVDDFLKEAFDYEKLSLRYRIQYTELLSVRGFNKEAIKVMYETRRKYFNQSDAHLRYIATLFRTEEKNDQWLHPKKVAPDTAVLIEDNNRVKTWYLIEDRPDADSAKNELTSQHPFGKKLLDKTIGDRVELVSTGPQKKYGKVLEIKSKYIYALHNSMSSYQTMFPKAEGLYGIDIKSSSEGKIVEKDLKILFEQIDKQHERYEMVLNLYKEGKLTIGAMARMLGRNPIEVWGLLTSSEDQELKCSIGDVNLRRSVQAVLNDSPKIVVDILSLMTIHGLEVADQVVTIFGKLLISQSTIDVLTELISNRKGLFSKGFMTVGKQGGQYVKEEISAEQLNKNTEYLKGVIKWIEKNCLIIPCREALTLDSDYRDKLYELFGESFIDSILIAKQEKALFYSDDERLRSFATGTYQVQGIWTQAVLEKLLILGVLDNEKYQDSIIRLVNSNYAFTSINADTLIESTKRSQWKPDRNFSKVVSLLNGKKCDAIPAVIVVGDYMQKLLNQPIYLDDPKNICFVVLDNAIKDRVNKQEFIKRLELRLNKLFLLSPSRLSEAMQILGAWLKTQIL